jgi:cyclase
MRIINGVIIFLALLVVAASAQRDFSKVEIKTTHVAGGIYMLEGSGGNIGVSVGEDGILIVDDHFAPLADKIREALRKLGGDKPKFILNTHWHSDHVGGNETFGRDGTIIAHDNVRKRLAAKQELFGEPVEPLVKSGLPVITFHQTLTVHFNGEEIRMVHVPGGHTDGDSVIFFTKSNVVHMGDHMFAGAFPFVDLDHGGDVEGMAKNVAKIIELAPPGAKFIPGHGPLSNLDDVKMFHRMLLETTKLVREKITVGKTLDEIKSEGVSAEWESWGKGFIKTDRWLETAYKSVQPK